MTWCSSRPPLHEHRVVGDVVGQRVLEHVGELGEERLLVDQLERLELAQEVFRSTADIGDPLEQATGELRPMTEAS